jgi:predicted nucleic acid-binding protein
VIVLDASVALKWIFAEEKGEDKARYYRDRHISGEEPAAVPDLFFYEIGNVLAIKTALAAEAAAEAFTLLWNFDLEVFSLGPEEFILGIAKSIHCKITLYDAAYIVLAEKLGCDLVTADKRLYEKVKGRQKATVLLI